MKQILLIILSSIILSCGKKETFNPRTISKVEINTLFEDSLLNVRAIDIINNHDALFFATSRGEFGVISDETITFPITVSDSLKLNFRSVATTSQYRFGLTIGSPALLYRMKNDLKDIVYRENHPKVFYDAMAFWNDHEGIAIGDPTDGCMSIIITRDGGETWIKLPCNDLPQAEVGEAAFAASDTNIAIVGSHTWLATGGKISRVLYSPDKGKSWQVFNTPIAQGLETQGMYAIDFYDELQGFAIGGDYTKPDENAANKIKTTDGGKTWQVVAKNRNPSYRSCVQYVPNRHGKELVAVGFKGIDFSSDGGKTLKSLSNEGFYTLRFLNDSVAYAAGNKRVSKLTFRE